MSKKILVVLDPGHYTNYNKGAAPGYYEGNKMYTLSEYERDALRSYGIDVILTRTRDGDMDLYPRGQVAVKNGAGYDEVIFMSNHSNGFDGSAYGVTAIRSLYLPKSVDLGQKLVNAVVGVMRPVTGITYSRGVSTRKGSSGADYYGVIRGSVSGAKSDAQAANGPVTHSFIVEHGFHDNKTECAFLNVDANLKKIAQAKASVIAEYFGLLGQASTSMQAPNIGATNASGTTEATTHELYRVQVGAFKNRANANALLDKLKAAGFDGYITSTIKSYEEPKKSVEEVAREVLLGKWGNGSDRKQRLTAAGYDYQEVQKAVNKLSK